MRIRLYGFNGCPMCQELKNLLDKDNINYFYVDVYDEKYKKEVTKIFELATVEAVPIVLIGQMVLAPDKSFKNIPHAHQIIKTILAKSNKS